MLLQVHRPSRLTNPSNRTLLTAK